MLQPRLALSLVAITFTLFCGSYAGKRCPQGWYGYKNTCYFFSSASFNWATARSICGTRGGKLATINDSNEARFISSQSKKIGSGKSYWVGVTDQGSEGKFRNIDNSKFPTDKNIWSKGQPDNYNKAEHCGAYGSWNRFLLNDAKCNQGMQFICERSIDYADPCDSENGWHLVKDNCYKFYKEPTTWSVARQTCQSADGDLITIKSNEEVSLVSESVACDNTASIWIGFSDVNPLQKLQWVDGSAATIQKWDTRNGEPNSKNAPKGKRCAASITLNKNLWELTNCDASDMAYVCEKSKGQCPLGWRRVKGQCLRTYYDSVTWPEARSKCEGYGGSLATMTQLSQNMAGTIFGSIGSYWVGISDRDQDGVFVDLDGQAVPTSVLKAQKPNKQTECGTWKAGGKTATLASCYSTNFYMCTASMGAVRATPTAAPSDGMKCYDGWTKYKGSCYMRSKKPANYNTAKADCVSKQGTLLVINDREEMDFLAADPYLVNTLVLFGLDDQKVEGTFTWVDSSPVTYTYWAPNEPNNHKGQEDCGEMQSRTFQRPLSWNDVPCTQSRNYICEAKAVPGEQITTPKPTRPWSSECGQGWVADHLSSKCYFFSEEAKNWNDARKQCQSMQSDLMSVSTKYDQTFLQGMLRGDSVGALAYWVGGNDMDTESGWRWTDGQPFAYFNWNDGEPNSAGDEDCIEVVKANGRWNDNSCNQLRHYICEKSTTNLVTKATSNTTPLPSISEDCTTVELLSGNHWVPNSALNASSVRDKDSGPENSRIDWTAADRRVTINTPNKYNYQPVANLNLKGVNTIRFTVQACNDAHISLQPAVDNLTRDAYEVVLGGWGNSQSVIRKEHSGTAQVIKKQRDVVNCNKASPFWITWKSGKIQVGTGYQVTGQTMLMELAVTDSLTIAGAAVSTGWGSTGVWVITNPHGTRKGAWSPKYDVKRVPIGTEQYIYKQWLQADLAKPTLIQSITTKGSASTAEYVVEYSIQYAYDKPYNFQDYIGTSDTNKAMYFRGNVDQNTPVTNNLDVPFVAQYVRIVPRKFINYPSLRWALNGCPPPKYCNPEPLMTGESILEDWTIKTSSLKDSTVYDSRLTALPGKDAPKGWVAAMPNVNLNTLAEEWIQIYLKRDMLLLGITTKGHAEQDYWVKSYQIQTKSPNGINYFVNYQQPYGTVKTFTANTDKDTAVTNMLTNPVITTWIRILPKDFNTMIAMRVEVLGCLAGCQLSPMLNGPNQISNMRLKASSSAPNLLPSKARLDTSGFASAWSPKIAKAGQFFQVDFGITERIYAISTQGRGDKDEWVTRYKVSYSYNAKSYFAFQGSSYTLPANSDRNTRRKNFLKAVLVARAIRIYPVSWKNKPSMRVEVYACSGSNTKYVGCYTEGAQADSFDGPTSYYKYNGPDKCAASCFKDGFMYAGLNRGTCKCGNMLPIGGQSKRCNYKCTANNNFFCGGYAAGVISVYETGRGPDDERCPSGYTTFNSKCYKINKIKESWWDARTRCQSEGGDLATINSVSEQAFLKAKLDPLGLGVWIGLNDLSEQMSFAWADGAPVLATFWMHSEPNNWIGKNEDCVEAISYKEMAAAYKDLNPQNGLWNDRPCEEQRFSMCQRRKEKNLAPMTTTPAPKGCPFGWKAYQSSCYLMIEHSSTWGLASYTCQKEGGSLVRINDDFEQSFITTELFARAGYSSSMSKTMYWTDLREFKASEDYKWSNKWDVIPYTHWAKGQPPAPQKPKATDKKQPAITVTRCVAMNGKNEAPTGYWSTQFCSSGAFPLCERARLGYKQPPLPTRAPEDIPCPSGWVGVGPNCYQINKPDDPVDMLMWLDAQKQCRRQGANLAYINNGTENEKLWRTYVLTPGSEVNRYWIGLNDRAKNNGYRWISGDAFSYSNWKAGEPNDWDGAEPCVMLDGADGLWNDEKCMLPMNWICSISRTKLKTLKNVVTTPEPTAGPSGSCRDGDDWKSYNNHCYYVNKDLLTFRESQAFCNSKGAHLVSITSNRENSFVRAISKNLITNFIDRVHDRSNIGNVLTQVWTGLNELDRSKGHRWIDGSPYKYSKWARNEPNDWNGGEYCVAMLVSNGEWNDNHCSARVPSVCEKNPSQTGPITTTTPPHIDGYCPTGYMAFENDCYRIEVNKKMNWTSAEFTCGTEGGHLAYILNSREQTFLTAQLNVAEKARTALWLGMKHGSETKSNFFDDDDSYVWSANQDVSYVNWNHGEPNGVNREACAEMLFNPAGRWNDVACPSERGFICKKPKDGSVKNPPSEDNSRCPSGYKYWQDGCYKMITSKGTWSYLDGNTCGADGAHLASIQNPYEYSFIRQWMWEQNIQEDLWIGLMSKAASNTFGWSNTWPVAVTYWGPNEPAQFASEEGCVLMDSGKGEDDGKWRHTSCREMHSAICKKPLTNPPFPAPQSGICNSAAGETWVANSDGYCYLFNIDPRYTFDEAESACRTAGSNLASLHSDTDTNFIRTHMEHMDVMGGNGGTKNVWIGLKKEQNGAFVWTDNSAVFYANWADNEPNSVESNEKCTEVWSPESNWNDVDCQSKRGFICKIKQGQQPATFPTPLNTPPTTQATTRKNSLCQLDGWQFYNGSCYLLVSQKNEYLRWNEAASYCKSPGREAHLVSIGSEEENQWIVDNLVPGGMEGDAWTGFAELRTDNRFSWTDSSRITYQNWASGQPNTNKGSMECVAMVMAGGNGVSGRWATEYCFSKKGFICEIDAKKQLAVTISTPVTDGKLCKFPFKYRGQDYNTCTTYGHDTFLWCGTTDNYDRDRKFAICDPFTCPPGWRRHERLCYYFSEATDQRSWLDSEAACAAQSADLAFIGAAAVESFIANNINEYFWMGLNDRRTEGSLQWDHRPNMVMIRGFTNWGINEPRNIFGTEDCATIVNGPYSDGRPGEWVMANCDLTRRYVCMKDAVYTLAPKTLPPTTTPIITPSTKWTTTGATAKTKEIIAVTAQPQVQSQSPSDMDSLRTGEITAIVIACVAVVLAGVFIALYLIKSRQTQSTSMKELGFENASYSRSNDSVHMGLENPNFSSD